MTSMTGLDQHGQRRGVIDAHLAPGRIGARGRRLEDDDAQTLMHLRAGQACAVGVDHGLDHVVDQASQFGM